MGTRPPLEILAFKAAREHASLTVHEPLINTLPLALEAARILDEDFAPLTKSGVIALYTPIRAYQSLVAQNLFGEMRWFSSYEMSQACPALYVAEGLE